MADLPSSFSKVNTVEMRQDTLNSELQYLKLGSNDNYLKDNLDAESAARAASRSAIQGDIDALKTEVNAKYVNGLILVGSQDFFSGALMIPARRVVSNFAFKRAAPDQTRVYFTVFNEQNDTILVQSNILINGLLPSAWDVHMWHVINQNQVRNLFYAYRTVSIP